MVSNSPKSSLQTLIPIFAVGLLLGSGCGTDDPTPQGNADGGASVESLTQAFCKAARTCCALAGLPAEPLADCESEYSRQLDYVALVAKGTVLIDEPALRACVAVYDELARTCQMPATGCAFFTKGTKADGESCDDAEECSNVFVRPTVCIKTGVTADSGPKSGVCQAIAIGKIGDPCSLSCEKGRLCSSTSTTSGVSAPLTTICREEDGLYCNRMSGCAALVVEGSACTDPSSCGSELYCDGVCKPRKAAGDACASFSECAQPLTCTNGTCTARPFAAAKLCSGDYN